MSGGSSKTTGSSKKDDKALPAYMTQAINQQPFMPGWDNMIAQQLEAGGYGNSADLLSQFQQIYKPVPGTGAPAPGTTGGGGGDRTNFVDGLIDLKTFLAQYARGY